MIKYVPLTAALNYIPETVKENASPKQLESWMWQAYRMVKILGDLEYQIAPINVVNHTARLPDDVIKIHDVIFTNESLSYVSELLTLNINEDKLLIYQKIFFTDLPNRAQVLRLMYKGQHRAAIIAHPLYCMDCEIGFTLDKTMTCLTIDLADGAVGVLYQRRVKEGNVMLIPDDSTLLSGLAEYAVGMFWKNRAYGHEQNAKVFSDDALQRAENLLQSFETNWKIKNIDIVAQHQFVANRNKFGFRGRN